MGDFKFLAIIWSIIWGCCLIAVSSIQWGGNSLIYFVVAIRGGSFLLNLLLFCVIAIVIWAAGMMSIYVGLRLRKKIRLKEYHERGKYYLVQSQYEQALLNYQKAIELDPYDAESYLNYGRITNTFREYDRAIDYFTKAIDLRPEGERAYVERGLVYKKRDDPFKEDAEKAFEDFTKAIELGTNNPDAYAGRAYWYEAGEEYEKAITDFGRAIELDPSNAEYFFARGVDYASLGDYQKAIIDLNMALELDPSNEEYQRELEEMKEMV